MLFETNSVSIILYRGITGWACSQLIIRRYTAAINFMLTFCVFLCTHVFSCTNIPRYMHSLRFCFLRFVLSRYRAIWQYYECPVTVRQLLRTWINTSAWLPGDWQYNYNNTEHNKKVTIPRPRKIPLKRSSRQRTVSLIFFHSKVKSDGNTYLYVHMWANRGRLRL